MNAQELFAKGITDQNLIEHRIKNADGSEDIYHIKLLPSEKCWEIVEAVVEIVAPIYGTWYDGDKHYKEDVGQEIGILVSKYLKGLNLISWSKIMLTGMTKNGRAVSVGDFFGSKGLSVLKELVTVSFKENCLDFFISEMKGMGLNLPSMESLNLDQE